MKLRDLLEKNITDFGEYPFLFFKEKTYSNIETRRYADQLAAGLRRIGIEKGDRVIVCMPNCPEVLFAYQGITRAGAIIVPVMFTLHPKELHYIARNSGAKAVITSSYVLQNIEKSMEALPERPAVILSDLPSNEHITNFYDLLVPIEKEFIDDGKANDTAVILYTSGTTGNPKGVLLTHKNLFSNAQNSAKHNDTERGTTLGVLPLAHVYGLTVSNVCYLTGSAIVVFSSFDVKEVLKAIDTFRVRTFSAVPAMIHAMVSYPNTDNYDTSSLESVGSGSAPLSVALLNAFEQKFGAKVLEGYGLSEAAPVVTAHSKRIEIKPGSVGVPIPGVEIKIVDGNGLEVPAGEVGELVVRGDNVTPGYYQNQQETNRVLKDSWLYTGDMARVDDEGYVYIVDRKKDLIIRGGFNVYPRDVEEILNGHEEVFEAAVVGIPDERMGEELVACVVKKPGSNVTEEELIQFCQDHLAKNKTPRKVIFLEALPRNGVGKILKTHLRQNASDIVIS
ncbi:long-chain fatty acid--CoA ligase [Bacillus sp. AFS076308]|uniref:long-chain-fatty-acid--CoA ligase n=1 Tax=unclassified Bacillus (in: firmicutes) TaxID=185979 RepID=UPI000BF9753E|nr:MULTISPECIES: long-chain fatty acid--CoA ligase [unclassified Bacillus (in: firmicutes)]PFN97744.1 long-chain fatty acid--CoA ligase [Bacillus sp. AFS076308]PGV51080.1 long-chain fatty acid--CoA ligase [Bacillus sp. AFS037270]